VPSGWGGSPLRGTKGSLDQSSSSRVGRKRGSRNPRGNWQGGKDYRVRVTYSYQPLTYQNSCRLSREWAQTPHNGHEKENTNYSHNRVMSPDSRHMGGGDLIAGVEGRNSDSSERTKQNKGAFT